MPVLGFACTEDNVLSVELLIDGQPLGKLIGSRDTAIPHWIIGDDLPHWPPFEVGDDPFVRIVTVCSCGEYGCGHARCRVIHDGNEVFFQDFEGDVSAEGGREVFRFSQDNYRAMVAGIVERVRQHEVKPSP